MSGLHLTARGMPFARAVRAFSVCVDGSKDYYAALGISKTANKQDMRGAYLKLAKKWHPDVHATKSDKEKEAARDKFQAIRGRGTTRCADWASRRTPRSREGSALTRASHTRVGGGREGPLGRRRSASR